jgi:hypothetical protein
MEDVHEIPVRMARIAPILRGTEPVSHQPVEILVGDLADGELLAVHRETVGLVTCARPGCDRHDQDCAECKLDSFGFHKGKLFQFTTGRRYMLRYSIPVWSPCK